MEMLNVNINGNKKLRNTENVRFMIWNLPAVKTCPFATEMCKKSCYARKAERVYPQVLPSRERNYIATQSPDFVPDMVLTIQKLLSKKAFAGKKVVFRIHESGDFYNQEYAKKWVNIAKWFENDDRIVFLAYTKSILYFINLGFGSPDFPANLVIRSSLWSDTSVDNVSRTLSHEFPIYTALKRSEMDEMTSNGEPFTECRCDDCGTCGKCWDKGCRDIICEIH